MKHVSHIVFLALFSLQTIAQAEEDISHDLTRLSNISAEARYIHEMLSESSAISLSEIPAIQFNYEYTEQALTYIMHSLEDFTLLSSQETEGTWDLNTGDVQRYELSMIRNVVITRSLPMKGSEQERLSLITKQVQHLYELVEKTIPNSSSLLNGFSFDYEHVLSIIEYIEHGLKAHISLINSMPKYMSTSHLEGISDEHP